MRKSTKNRSLLLGGSCVGPLAMVVVLILVWNLRTEIHSPSPVSKPPAAHSKPQATPATDIPQANTKTVKESSAEKPPTPPKPQEEKALPIVGPSPNDPMDRPAHPHPITPTHIQMARLRAIHLGLSQALKNRDFDQMRALLVEHGIDDPSDVNKTRQAYRLLGECLENPRLHTRQKALDFYNTETASTLRRKIRVLCLE